MKKYYFIHGGMKCGPFTKEELRNERISHNTLVWFHPLKDWLKASDVEELSDVYKENISVKKKNKFLIFAGMSLLLLFVYLTSAKFLLIEETGDSSTKNVVKKNPSPDLYNQISSSSFDSDVDFNIYVEKFYRDARFFGIAPISPKKQVIKFAPLDKIPTLTHIHALSFGFADDERIEIYINPSTWEAFNKPMRYVLMYHELFHDVLNLKDLPLTTSNQKKLIMYPSLAHFRSFTMDDFIESSQRAFAEYASDNP